jgi:transposase
VPWPKQKKARDQRRKRRQKHEYAFLFTAGGHLLGEVERVQWEVALADCGGDVAEAATACGRNEMDPPLCGSTAMSHNEFQSSEPIEPQEASPMKHEMHVLGIDIAKRVFHAVGMDDRGNIVYRKRLSRHDLLPCIAKLPPVLIGIEACGGAHYWARRFREHGHEVKLMAPQFVKPYVKSNKNDSRDAEAIAEAVTRPTMRFVPIKDVDQQDIQALHRVRERLIGERTALVNEVHGLMHEYGIVLPKGVAKFRQAVVGKLESEKDKLTPLSQELFWKLVEEFAALEAQLAYYQEKLDTLAQTHPECQRLMTIPGIGPFTATALVAAVSDATAFKNGRQFAAWLGLVPRQHTTGGKERLLGISKRGDTYLRKLLVHGARATIRWVGRKTDRRSQWIRHLLERRGKNRTAVAVANKNARIVWALLTSHEDYQPAKG